MCGSSRQCFRNCASNISAQLCFRIGHEHAGNRDSGRGVAALSAGKSRGIPISLFVIYINEYTKNIAQTNTLSMVSRSFDCADVHPHKKKPDIQEPGISREPPASSSSPAAKDSQSPFVGDDPESLEPEFPWSSKR